MVGKTIVTKYVFYTTHHCAYVFSTSVFRVTVPPFGDSHLKYYKKSESPLFNALANIMDVGPSLLDGLRGALQNK